MKKIIILTAVMVCSLGVIAQPPTPGGRPTSPANSRINRDGDSQPVGTATLLMLGMGGAYLGYKVKKNKKK